MPTLLYDGTCRFCTKHAMRLRRLTHGHVTVESAYAPGVREQFPMLPLEGRLGQMTLVDADSRVYLGAAAIFRSLELGRGVLGLVAPLYRFPPFRVVTDRIYAFIAKRRYRLGGTCDDGSCET